MMRRPDLEREGFPSSMRRWTTLAFLSIAVFLSFTDRLIINLIVHDMRTDLGFTDLEISLLQGLGFALIYATGGIPMGRLADTWSRRKLVIGGMVTWSVATAACGLATTFGGFLACRIVVGLGEAVLIPAAASMITDSFPEAERGKALGFLGMGGVLGSGVALTVGGLLLSVIGAGMLRAVPFLGHLPAWRNLLILAGLPGLLLASVAFAIREPIRRDRRGVEPVSAVLLQVLADRGRIAKLCLAIGVVAAGDYALLSWLPALMEREFGTPSANAGPAIGMAVILGGAAGCILGGWVADRVAESAGKSARTWVMTMSYAACAVCMVLVPVASPGLLVVVAALWVFGSVAGNVAGMIVLQESVPNEMRGMMIALSNMCSAVIGLGLGPTLPIIIGAAFTGSHGLLYGIAATCIGAAVLGAFLTLRFGKRILGTATAGKLEA